LNFSLFFILQKRNFKFSPKHFFFLSDLVCLKDKRISSYFFKGSFQLVEKYGYHFIPFLIRFLSANREITDRVFDGWQARTK